MPDFAPSVLWTLLAVALVALGLTLLRALRFSFAAQRPGDYAGTAPVFDPQRVLNGPLDSEGVIFGPTGRASSRFVMRMEGHWTGNTGRLTEDFTYETGRTQSREWRLTLLPGGMLSAEADDIIGTGEGRVSGSTLRLSYRLRLPADAGGHVLDVVDWLYLMPNGTIMNRSQMHRFGLPLAELIATMRPGAGQDIGQAPMPEALPRQASEPVQVAHG